MRMQELRFRVTTKDMITTVTLKHSSNALINLFSSCICLLFTILLITLCLKTMFLILKGYVSNEHILITCYM